MSKQWTRNYDNLFSAVYGCGYLTSFGTTDPTFDVPYIQHTDGLHYPIYKDGYYRDLALCRALSIPQPCKYGVSTTLAYPGAGRDFDKCTCIGLGTGSTEPSYDDYQLESPITSGMTMGIVTEVNSYDSDTHIYTKTYKIPISYSGTDDVTITEFGIYASVTACHKDYGYATLVYRETLETPVTLSQNDTIEITFSQSIMQPNFTEYPATE